MGRTEPTRGAAGGDAAGGGAKGEAYEGGACEVAGTAIACPEIAGSEARARVLTVGHSNRPFAQVVAMLSANAVTDLVDIRSYPSSRAHPQWNREAIIGELPEAIRYHWLRDLGGRRHTPAGTPSPNGGWRVKAFRDYADYLATDEFARGLDELLALTEAGRPAIMCSEAVPWRCHRRLVTDALLVRGVPVGHIMSPTSVRPAEVTPFLRVRDGLLTYPPDAEAEPSDTQPSGTQA